MRVGQGFDVHRFKTGDYITLAGVKIPFSQAIEAHSDGDVILHALCDALLGAMGLGDIGQYFPDTDPQYKNADSRKFLRQVNQILKQQHYRILNIDITLIAQAPKIAPYRDTMREHLTLDLDISPLQINIKATTTEHLGFCGRGEGIAAMAIACIEAMK